MTTLRDDRRRRILSVTPFNRFLERFRAVKLPKAEKPVKLGKQKKLYAELNAYRYTVMPSLADVRCLALLLSDAHTAAYLRSMRDYKEQAIHLSR